MAGFDVAKATEASDQRGRAAAALTDAIIAQRRQPGSQITPPVAAPAQVRPFSDPGPVRAYPHAQVEAAAGGADENLQDLPAARRVSLPGGIGCLAAMLTDEETHPAVVPHGHGERPVAAAAAAAPDVGIGATNSRKRNQNSVAQTAQDKRDRQKVMVSLVTPMYDRTGQTKLVSSVCGFAQLSAAPCHCSIATGKCCLERAGGFDHCYALRCAHWEVDTVVPKKQKQTSASTDDTKVVPRGQQTARRHRLKSMLKRMVTRVADAEQPYATSFFVTNSDGAQVPVCKAFFMACFGYTPNGSMWNSVMEEVMEESIVPGGVTGPASAESMSRSGRGKDTASYIAEHILLYGQQMPHLLEIRLDYRNKEEFYEAVQLEMNLVNDDSVTGTVSPDSVTVDASGEPAAGPGSTCPVSTDPEIQSTCVKRSRFYELLNSDTVKAAVEQKCGFPSTCCNHEHRDDDNHAVNQGDEHDRRFCKLAFKDPTKKREFSVCSVCADIAAARRQAAVAGDRTKFLNSVALMTMHMEAVSARRDLYYKYIAMSKKQPKKHMTIIVDGIDKSKVESPMFNSAQRWSKTWKDALLFPIALVAALSFGAKGDGGCHRHLFFNDMVVGGDGSGSINTVNVIWRVLMHHQKNGTLPTDSDTRELHLQFDNCGDNKNWLVLGFCELLVHFKIFTKVTVNFLTVGHTHENIDQLFSVLNRFLLRTDKDLTTLPKLCQEAGKALRAVQVEEFEVYPDWQKMLLGMVIAARTVRLGVMNGEMSGHSGRANKQHDTLNFGFEFWMNEEGKRCGRYQPLEELSSAWYPLTLLRAKESDCAYDADSAIVLDLFVEVHPLKEYPSSFQKFVGKDKDGNDRELLRETIRGLHDASPQIIDADSLKYWETKLASFKPGTAEYVRRVSSCCQDISFRQLLPALTQEAAPVDNSNHDALRAHGVAQGIMRPLHEGATITTRNTNADVSPETDRISRITKTTLMRGVSLALRDGTANGLVKTDLPTKNEWVVFKYLKNLHVSEGVGAAMVDGDPVIDFCLAKVLQPFVIVTPAGGGVAARKHATSSKLQLFVPPNVNTKAYSWEEGWASKPFVVSMKQPAKGSRSKQTIDYQTADLENVVVTTALLGEPLHVIPDKRSSSGKGKKMRLQAKRGSALYRNDAELFEAVNTLLMHNQCFHELRWETDPEKRVDVVCADCLALAASMTAGCEMQNAAVAALDAQRAGSRLAGT